MKKVLLALLIPVSCFLSASSCSKHENREVVPDEVIVQFDKDHEDAEKVYWEPKKKNYEAKFIEDDVEKVIVYSPEAKPLRLEYVVVKEEVPPVVITRLEKKYPKMEIEHVTFIEVPRREPYYVVKVKQPTMIRNVEISVTGVIIRAAILENLSVKIKSFEHHDHDDDDHDDCDHHKHKRKKHKHGKGHGHCNHDDGYCMHGHDDAVIKIRL